VAAAGRGTTRKPFELNGSLLAASAHHSRAPATSAIAELPGRGINSGTGAANQGDDVANCESAQAQSSRHAFLLGTNILIVKSLAGSIKSAIQNYKIAHRDQRAWTNAYQHAWMASARRPVTRRG